MSSIKGMLAAMLLRLYPARWRQEYGDELDGVLHAEGFALRDLVDVLRSAMGQQLRIGEPWVIIGAPLLILNLVVVAANILNPWTYADNMLIASLAQKLWFWMPALFVGCWTVLRSRRQRGGGRAAMKMAFLVNWPVSAIALFAGLGILRVVTLGPGDLPGSFSHDGLTVSLYDSLGHPIHLVPLFLLPILNLPFAGIGGWFGGLIARGWLRVKKEKV